MSETKKSEMPSQNGDGWSAHFLNWAGHFQQKHTYVHDANTEGGFRFAPLSELLSPIKKMRVSERSANTLERNLLYACYQAIHSKEPEDYSTTLLRRKWENTELAISSQQAYVKKLKEFSGNYPDVFVQCFYKGTPHKVGSGQVDASSRDVAITFQALLDEYAVGLKRVLINSAFAMGPNANFGLGPFAYDKEVREIEKRERPDVITLGLCFHLVYLFRYFTAEHPLPKQDAFSATPEFYGEELKIWGEMLPASVGKPHYAIVAALVNACFKSKMSPDDIKLRLKDQHRPSKKVLAKLAGQNRYISFTGWETTIQSA